VGGGGAPRRHAELPARATAALRESPQRLAATLKALE